MTREEAFRDINETQDYYVNELKATIEEDVNEVYKEIYFTSPTGTGKTNMISKLINSMPNYYFIITTLSKGGLDNQTRAKLQELNTNNNYVVYGSASYKSNTRLQGKDILNNIPDDYPFIWIRDEAHIRTQKFSTLFDEKLFDKCDKLPTKIVNVSATNTSNDKKISCNVVCNFTNTMMLRTVEQEYGDIEDALNKLKYVKKQHKNVLNYNPCAIFRCVKGRSIKDDEQEDLDMVERVKQACIKYGFKYIHIQQGADVQIYCADDNEYDVIINKHILTEGIDIRRAHIIWMDNKPKNPATTIQAIGRCRRNALLYRDDIDILAEENADLLKATRVCYAFYNVDSTKLATNKDNELIMEHCPYISCQKLKSNRIIEVVNGQLCNGLFVYELLGCTGQYKVLTDNITGFNIICTMDEQPVTFYNMYTNIRNSDRLILIHNDSKALITSDILKYFPKFAYVETYHNKITDKNECNNHFIKFLYRNYNNIDPYFYHDFDASKYYIIPNDLKYFNISKQLYFINCICAKRLDVIDIVHRYGDVALEIVNKPDNINNYRTYLESLKCINNSDIRRKLQSFLDEFDKYNYNNVHIDEILQICVFERYRRRDKLYNYSEGSKFNIMCLELLLEKYLM